MNQHEHSQVTDPASGATEPKVKVGQLEIDDFSLWEEVTEPWDLMVKPLDARPFRNRKTYLVTSSVILYRESFASCFRVHGLTPAHMFTLSVPLCVGPRTTYWKMPPDRTCLPVSMPGGLDAVVDAHQDHLILLIALDLLQRNLPEERLADLGKVASLRALRGTRWKLDRFGQWLSEVLAKAVHHPEAFRHAAVVRSFEQDLLRSLTQVGMAPCTSAGREDMSLRRRGLDRALEYLRTIDPVAVTVTDLCKVACVSERTLEYAFHETVGMAPLSFIRHRRLHAARRALLAQEQGRAKVADVAHRLGFLELGRFAAHYRRLFGELPSQTMALRRRTLP